MCPKGPCYKAGRFGCTQCQANWQTVLVDQFGGTFSVYQKTVNYIGEHAEAPTALRCPP